MLDLIAIRRALHQIPEIGLEEFETHAYLMAKLQELTADKPFVAIKTWQTGIIVKVNGTAPEKTIGWRTDIDGLPITEATGLDFASRHEGRMHACGHDIHMTLAIGILEAMLMTQPKNNLIFLFQPAEENEAGGMLMYEAGVLSGDWRPDEFYGLHIRPDLKVGEIATNTHTLFAGTCEVKIKFKGTGGHAAFPHHANDALVAASYFITQVQTIVSRNVDPIEGAVVTFGSLHAGTTNNVIAETAQLHGTIRTLTQEMNLLTQARIRAIAEGVALSFGISVDIQLRQGGYLPVENDPDLAKALMTFFDQQEGVTLIDIAPAMTGEDFGYLLSKIPGVMFWLGVETPYALHHPKLSPNEAALDFGVKQITAFLKHLAGG
ncbi:MAG: N-acetyldiaminopimelate deacetylase [Streptococcaceae bacterium]|jgi:N-acetyldiaminopimelate deacetylase|nr:N-acetyldiaminopimelate deacetylase [Streptococcaceae bacterium]